MNWQFPNGMTRLVTAWRHWLPGSVAAIVAAILFLLGVLQPLELQVSNTLFRWRGNIPWDPRIVVVAIDDTSLAELGEFPLSRQVYARLLYQLTDAQAAIVVFNLVFSETTPDDQILAEAMLQNGRVVLAQAWDYSGMPLLPTSRLDKSAFTTGHILNRPDADGISRKISPIMQEIPSLSVAATTAFSLAGHPGNAPVFPPPTQQFLWLNWLGSSAHLPASSLVQVLRGNVPLDYFRDKLVIVGVTAAGVDRVYTPFDRIPPSSGVHLLATAIDNLLQNRPLHVPSHGWMWFLWVGVGTAWSIIIADWHWQRRLLWLLGALVSCGIIGYLTFLIHYWLPIGFLAVGFVMTTLGVELGDRLRLYFRLQRDIQRLWQVHYHDQQADLLALTDPTTPAPAPTNQPTLQLAQLAEQFARAQSAYAAIARNISLGILATNAEGQVWFCNPLASEWLGTHVGDHLPSRLTKQWKNSIDWQMDWQVLHQGTHCYHEVHHQNQWFALKLEPLLYQPVLAPSAPTTTSSTFNSITAGSASSSSTMSVLIVLEDITTRKQAQEELQNALTRERELKVLKSSFATMMSHELRTPLTAISTAAELLEHYDWTPEQRRAHFQQIRNAIEYMLQLMNDVLLMGKVEEGRVACEPQFIDPQMLSASVLEEMRLLATDRHHLSLHATGNVRFLSLDPKLLRQILVNLISNAIKYSPDGGDISLTLDYRHSTIVLQVTDNGIGIPEIDQKHLFQAFHRAANVETIQGTGLGLAIVQRCVNIHGGSVTVRSEENKGTTFTVTIPVID